MILEMKKKGDIVIENFEKLEFNRKVDVLVAMHVMGWKEITITEVTWGPGTTKWQCKSIDRFGAIGYIPLYSTLLSSAWDIVRVFSDFTYLFRNKEWRNGDWECKVVITDLPQYYGWAETEMLAICYAGLKATGFNVKGFLITEGKEKEEEK